MVDLRSGRRRFLYAVGAVVAAAAIAITWYVIRGRIDHDVSFRMTSSDGCTPNVLVTVGRDAKLIVFEHTDYVASPWQSKTYAQRRGDRLELLVTGGSECGPIQCRIVVDGEELVAKTAPRQVQCEAEL